MTEDVYTEATKTILSETMFGNFLTTDVLCHKQKVSNFKMPNPDYDEIELNFSILVEMWQEKGDKNIFIFRTSEFIDRYALTSHSYLCMVANHLEGEILNMINKNINSEVKSVTFRKTQEVNHD